MSELLKVSSNPHIRSKVTTSSIMTAVVIALLPAAGFGIYNFGPRALAVMAVTIASTVLTELLFGWLWKKKITITVGGGHRTAAGTESAGKYSSVDGCPGRCVCNSCSKNVVWRPGTKFYEPGTGSKMFLIDLFPFADDELRL